ncbi:MAG: aldolase [Verrucomicrobiaceae bacterium TMED76]|nr:MAG: aldolase [Verrucomicrobiaceae bacterium TMED76]
MNPEEFCKALRSEQRMYGTLVVSTSPFWPKIIGDCGLDFIFIDTEHIAISRETLSWMCRTYNAMGLPTLVRITDPDPDRATVALDDGAAAIVAPYIEKVDQVKALKGATKLRPLKGKKLERVLNGETIEPELEDYINNHNAGNGLVINIESTDAMENLDDLLEVDGTDAVLIGPHDLSCSLGVPEKYDHPDFLKSVESIFTKVRSKGIGAGIHFWGSNDEHKRLLDMGANFLVHKADAILFRTGLRKELVELRELMGDSTNNSEGTETAI